MGSEIEIAVDDASSDEEFDDDTTVEEGRILREIVGRRAAESRLRYRPQRIETFNEVETGAQAGKVYEMQGVPGTTHGERGFSKFAEDVQSLSRSTSAYAPFSSKMDWEIACWVKANDVGANVLQKLLAIEGVRCCVRQENSAFNAFNRLSKPWTCRTGMRGS